MNYVRLIYYVDLAGMGLNRFYPKQTLESQIVASILHGVLVILKNTA